MSEAQSIFPGGAFEGGDGSAAVVGEISVSMFSVHFVAEGLSLVLPAQGLQIDLDETGERVLFSHANFPGWTVYSLDAAILDHHCFRQAWLKRRVEELKVEHSGAPTHAKRVYKTLGAIVLILAGLWLFTDPIVGLIVKMLPPEWEAKVGKEAFAELRIFFPLSDEPALTNRVHLVSQRLRKGLPPDAPQFRFHVSEMPMLNAIALPGGDVMVMGGLLADASPDELAAVLAHEMAHVIEKHAMRHLAQEAGATFVAKYVFGGDSALAGLVAGASILGQLQYSRENERAADAMAFRILVDANIDPRGLAKFFEKIQKMEKKLGRDNDLFSTHPPTEERIKKLEKLWSESPKKSGFEPVKAPELPDEYKNKKSVRLPFLL